jgi:VWFA-related protein
MMGSLQGQANEFFLVSFNDTVTLIHDFTKDPTDILELVESQSPAGRTALRDAVKLGLTTMEHASNERRVLILISDGGENKSASKKDELEQIIRGREVTVYAVAASKSVDSFKPRFSDAFLLSQLAQRSGGTFLHANTIEAFLSAADQIAYELRNQHVLRFAPRPGESREWREVVVKIRWQDHRRELLDAGLKPPLLAHTRRGYYYEAVQNRAP